MVTSNGEKEGILLQLIKFDFIKTFGSWFKQLIVLQTYSLPFQFNYNK